MTLVVLGLLTWDAPYPSIEIDLRPFHRRDFVAPLRGEQEELEQRPERPAELGGGAPENPNFLFAQNAVAGLLFGRRSQPVARIARYAVLFDRPAEERPKAGEDAIGLDLSAGRGFLVDKSRDVAPQD